MNQRALILTTLLALGSLGACSSAGTTSSTSSGGSGGGASTSSSSVTSSAASSGTGGAGTGGHGGAGTGGAGTGGAGTGGQAAFALTSTGFTEGAAIPAKYACAGANVSPDLAWTAGPPPGTKSYAVVFTDKSNNLIHWVIWDIPFAEAALPEHVANVANPPTPAGAKQVKSYDNQTFGYLGPCPPSQHTYEFAVHALDVATLSNVTTASARKDVAAEIAAHEVGAATLSGTFTP